MSENTVMRRPAKRSIRQWFAGIVGEMNALRQSGLQSFGFFTPYQLDSSRVDYKMARELYRNTNDKYKLGAGFAKPIINTTAGFMGVPSFTHENPDANQALEDDMRKWRGKLLRTNRNSLRDGDVFARLSYQANRFDRQQKDFKLTLTPPEWVTPVVDPLTGEWSKVVIRHPVKVLDGEGRQKTAYTVEETIMPDTRTIEADGRAPAEVREQNGEESNPWGFIPIVHFKNEAEENQLYGASDLEPVEPFLKAYHDVMLFAVRGSKLFSRPKAKFKLKNVDKFLQNNFSAEEIKSGTLKFDTKEIYLLQDEEEAEFITADSGFEGITTLLKFIFRCIVDVSQTPEFAFGTAVASSKASVSEQMVPLSRMVERKRGMFEEPYGELASMYLGMWAQVQNVTLETYEVGIEWDEVSPEDDKETAQTISTLVTGLTDAMESGLMSAPAAVEYLREYVPTMLPWEDKDADTDEKTRIAETFALLQRLQDGQGLSDEPPGRR